MVRLLTAHLPRRGQPDLRGFEWRYLWRLSQRGDALFTCRGKEQCSSVAFSPDGKTVAMATGDGIVRLCDVRTGQELAALRGATAGASSVAFSADGKRLIAASDDRTVGMWEIASRRLVATLPGPGNWSQAAYSPDGRTLATLRNDGAVELW